MPRVKASPKKCVKPANNSSNWVFLLKGKITVMFMLGLRCVFDTYFTMAQPFLKRKNLDTRLAFYIKSTWLWPSQLGLHFIVARPMTRLGDTTVRPL